MLFQAPGWGRGGGEKREGSRKVIKKLTYEGNRDQVSISGIYMKNEDVMVERWP